MSHARADRGALAWLAVAALLAAMTAVAGFAPTGALDWQPALAAREPWRAWTAVGVHYGARHLAANAAGLAVVAALGWAARLPVHGALAWSVAWPLTQAGLAVEPALSHAGGLSGVLHAGVAVAAVHLVVARRGASRAIGAAMLAGLVGKVVLESPWGPPLRALPGADFAVAPLFHAAGLVAGAAAGGLAEALARRLQPRMRRTSDVVE